MVRVEDDLGWLAASRVWITRKAAQARHPGLHKCTIYRWVHCGYLPHQRTALGRFLLHARSLDDLVARPANRFPPVAKGGLRRKPLELKARDMRPTTGHFE